MIAAVGANPAASAAEDDHGDRRDAEHHAADRERQRRVPVERRIQQPFGLVHGGTYAALAETMVSWATVIAVAPDGNLAVGQANSTTFMRPVTEGHVHAEGIPRHRGRTTWVWDVEFTDDEGRLCALSRVTLAVRPNP